MGVNKAQIKSPSGLLKLGALVRHDFFLKKCRLFWELYLYLLYVFVGANISYVFRFRLVSTREKEEKQHTHAPIRHEEKGRGRFWTWVEKEKKFEGYFYSAVSFYVFRLRRTKLNFVRSSLG